jgi:ribosome-associated heat shock protein Hsp15
VTEAVVESNAASQRLDVWLDIACLFKTRSLARSACQGGKVEVNGRVAWPSRLLHLGDGLRRSVDPPPKRVLRSGSKFGRPEI